MQCPVIIQNHEGMTMDLTMGSPAMLSKLMMQAHDGKIEERVEQALLKRGQACEEGLQRSVVRTLCRNKKINAREKSRLMQLVSGTVQTVDWLRKHGWAIEPEFSCGLANDTLEHRVDGCMGGNPETGEPRRSAPS
jgi:hypothetical protein